MDDFCHRLKVPKLTDRKTGQNNRNLGWWFQASLKIMLLRSNSILFAGFGVKIPKIFELPPPRNE